MRKRLALVAAALALVGALLPSTPVGAQTTPLTIKVSAGLGREVPGFTTRAFAPIVDGVPTVKIHSGDTIHLKGAAILLPEGQDPDAWRAEMMGEPSDPWAFVKADPDADVPGFDAPVSVNGRNFMPSSDCGFTADNPCQFDGSDSDPDTGAVNSGDQGDWYVTITGQPNSTFYAVSQFPFPTSDFLIQIVPPNEATTTQAELDEAKRTQRAEDRATALSLMESLNVVNRYNEEGKTIVDIYAGYDEGPVSLLAYFPQKVRIRRSDTVRFRFDRATIEPHTATFPFKAANNAARTSLYPACDPDGTGPGPDQEANFSEAGPPCDEGEEFEFDLSRRMTAQIGDGVHPGTKPRYENSGLRGLWIPEGIEGLAGGTGSWDVTFDRSSTTDMGYRFMCVLHGNFMWGAVKVR